jgi:hypothetical protein
MTRIVATDLRRGAADRLGVVMVVVMVMVVIVIALGPVFVRGGLGRRHPRN